MLGRLYWVVSRKLRNAERQRLAASRGWRFAPSDADLLARWGPGFTRGDHREIAGVVRGEVGGIPFTAFDYRLRTKIEIVNLIFRTETWDTQTIWVLHLPAALPHIEYKGRQKVSQKVLDKIGGDKPVRTGDEDLDRNFRVYSRHPEFVRALLAPELRTWLREHKLVGWFITDSDLILWKDSVPRIRVRKVAAVAEEMADMVAHFPAAIWQQYGQRQTGSSAPR